MSSYGTSAANAYDSYILVFITNFLPILEDTIVLLNHFGYRINIGMKVIGQYTYAHQMSIMYFYVNCN